MTVSLMSTSLIGIKYTNGEKCCQKDLILISFLKILKYGLISPKQFSYKFFTTNLIQMKRNTSGKVVLFPFYKNAGFHEHSWARWCDERLGMRIAKNAMVDKKLAYQLLLHTRPMKKNEVKYERILIELGKPVQQELFFSITNADAMEVIRNLYSYLYTDRIIKSGVKNLNWKDTTMMYNEAHEKVHHAYDIIIKNNPLYKFLNVIVSNQTYSFSFCFKLFAENNIGQANYNVQFLNLLTNAGFLGKKPESVDHRELMKSDDTLKSFLPGWMIIAAVIYDILS